MNLLEILKNNCQNVYSLVSGERCEDRAQQTSELEFHHFKFGIAGFLDWFLKLAYCSLQAALLNFH